MCVWVHVCVYSQFNAQNRLHANCDTVRSESDETKVLQTWRIATVKTFY